MMPLFLHFYLLCGRLFTVALLGSFHYLFGKVAESLTGSGIVESDRMAGVARFADALHDRYLPQQSYVHLLGKTFASLFAEEIVAIVGKFGRCKPAHVFNQSQNGHIYFSPVNMLMPFRASARATSWGVVTTMAPVMARVCTKVRCMSLVPGGRSRTK